MNAIWVFKLNELLALDFRTFSEEILLNIWFKLLKFELKAAFLNALDQLLDRINYILFPYSFASLYNSKPNKWNQLKWLFSFENKN